MHPHIRLPLKLFVVIHATKTSQKSRFPRGHSKFDITSLLSSLHGVDFGTHTLQQCARLCMNRKTRPPWQSCDNLTNTWGVRIFRDGPLRSRPRHERNQQKSHEHDFSALWYCFANRKKRYCRTIILHTLLLVPTFHSPFIYFLLLQVGGSLAVSLAFNVVNAKARRGVSSSGGSASGPRAVKRPHRVPFGKVGEENRGKVRTYCEVFDFDHIMGEIR